MKLSSLQTQINKLVHACNYDKTEKLFWTWEKPSNHTIVLSKRQRAKQIIFTKNMIWDIRSHTSSVASFLVLGGGGQDPEMYRQKKCTYIARASA